ncbi:histone deacetylase family protein [Dongia mobilis]|jgi:acetoin utilization deacetylase AcuC-like enzyme|uniref:histone deacetylase family protein n=1 Tax=Dongia sp. TaxID=1977262 RepID=UPI001DD46017|nr:histone deacetylase family protein [Rhodospirillaceae bacterium]
MRTVFSEDHRLQDGKHELLEGQFMKAHESPSRAEIVIERVRSTKLGEVLSPSDFGLDPILKVHDKGLVDFLAVAWDEWAATGRTFDALPHVWPVPGLSRGALGRRISDCIDGKLGHYAIDAGTPIMSGTWAAVKASANVALTAQKLVATGERSAFALCRPPGHHAGSDFYGGYCFLNNAGIAAQAFRDQGAKRVAILDVDYHHGNGTQQMFYERDDVLTISLHADPRQEFPYFLGYADEMGVGAGEGYHMNLPLPWGTDWRAYAEALEIALKRIRQYGAEALVVSLGLDTFEHDPISRFKLVHDDYQRLGDRIAWADLPTLFVMEGGYAVEALGVNTVNVLMGFEQRT